jgi:hypothetical protein
LRRSADLPVILAALPAKISVGAEVDILGSGSVIRR